MHASAGDSYSCALRCLSRAVIALEGGSETAEHRRAAARWIRQAARSLEIGEPLSPAERARLAAVNAVMEDALATIGRG